jgi:hypothetical protein
METNIKPPIGFFSLFNGQRLLKNFRYLLLVIIFSTIAISANAHCDSYDGPVIKDARKALETNNPELVIKWISLEQEPEIRSLFSKTYQLRGGDKEIYQIVEKHFLESLVRLHRETEGAPYTGLKPAGSTKPIISMSDQALESGNIDELLLRLNRHIDSVIREKFETMAKLDKKKEESSELGREFVKAYVDYTHTIEALHDVLEHTAGGHNH